MLNCVKHKEWFTAYRLKSYDLQFLSSFSAIKLPLYVMQTQYITSVKLYYPKYSWYRGPHAVRGPPVGQPWVRRKYLMFLVCALRRSRLRLDADANHTGHCPNPTDQLSDVTSDGRPNYSVFCRLHLSPSSETKSGSLFNCRQMFLQNTTHRF